MHYQFVVSLLVYRKGLKIASNRSATFLVQIQQLLNATLSGALLDQMGLAHNCDSSEPGFE